MSSNNHSSVPSAQISSSGQNIGGQHGKGGKSNDTMIMYCSYFSYCPESAIARSYVTTQIDSAKILQDIKSAEASRQITQGTLTALSTYFSSDGNQQRFMFDDTSEISKKGARGVIKAFFEIIEKLRSEQETSYFALCHLNGILEDQRSRVSHFIEIMNHFKESVNLIKILLGFLQVDNGEDNKMRDIASHILAILIEAQKKESESYIRDSTDFLNWLQHGGELRKIRLSHNAFTFALMTILKKNHLARDFANVKGFKYLDDLITGPCIEQTISQAPQIAYNTIVIMWIMSFHDFAQKFFEDDDRELLQKSAKVLDFFSWEKITRILLMLFDNLKENALCQDQMTEMDALNLITKLQNRHWVDQDITKSLEKLWQFFDENQETFSSIEKWKKQVMKSKLRWGPCHTERFWQENHVAFDHPDNLKLIDPLIECLGRDDTTKAVACFDLGEFCRFYAQGKGILERKDVKTKMANLMKNNKVSAQVKKEAITCYQKLLMGSWSSGAFKI